MKDATEIRERLDAVDDEFSSLWPLTRAVKAPGRSWCRLAALQQCN